MRNSLILLLTITIILSLVACERRPQERLFSDTQVHVEFSTLQLSISEDILYDYDGFHLWIYFPGSALPLANIRLVRETLEAPLSITDRSAYFAVIAGFFPYRGESSLFNWSFNNYRTAKGLPFYSGIVHADGYFFGFDEILKIKSGIFAIEPQ